MEADRHIALGLSIEHRTYPYQDGRSVLNKLDQDACHLQCRLHHHPYCLRRLRVLLPFRLGLGTQLLVGFHSDHIGLPDQLNTHSRNLHRLAFHLDLQFLEVGFHRSLPRC